jgi:addiction module HigA family antidote
MPMKNPSHPGSVVRHACIEGSGLSVTAAAKVLGVSRQALNNLVNGKAALSSDMAIRITKAFGGDVETWLQMQMNYDLAQARKREKSIHVRRFKPEEARRVSVIPPLIPVFPATTPL